MISDKLIDQMVEFESVDESALQDLTEQAQEPEDIRIKVRDAIAETLGDAMDCTRVWNAWNVGTMTQDDFAVINKDEDRLMEIVDAALQALQPPSPIEQASQVNERKVFELAFFGKLGFRRDSFGEYYVDENTNNAWRGWKERASIARGGK